MNKTEFYEQDFDSEEEYLLEALNDNYGRQYVIDINYNRPLKNFPLTLNKIDEVDETSVSVRSAEVKDENGNPIGDNHEVVNVLRKEQPEAKRKCERAKTKERPKSASCAVDLKRDKEDKHEKRPRSSCANYPSRIPVRKQGKGKTKSDSESSSLLSQGFDKDSKIQKKRSHSSCERLYSEAVDERYTWARQPERSVCPCCMRPSDHYDPRVYGIKRSHSQPNISRRQSHHHREPTPEAWSDISRYKRSLRLLGLSNSDFGLPESPKTRQQLPPRPRSSHNAAPTFSTKVLERSISLDSLKEIVRESASDDISGFVLPQRRLLAQAAYEEWYFKKIEESEKVLQQEQEKVNKQREILEEETRRRHEQAGEKFRQWLDSKRKEDRNKRGKRLKLEANLDVRLLKSKEEIDRAYLEWKKKKQTDLDEKKQRTQKEIEREEREKAQKEERKRLAEKVFKEWKKKLEETERERREKEDLAKEKIKEAITTRSNKTNKSFKVWKEMKEDEMKARWRNARNAAKQAEATRSMQLTERMYEAEEAFEEWLDKVDIRKQKQMRVKSHAPKAAAPWAPA